MPQAVRHHHKPTPPIYFHILPPLLTRVTSLSPRASKIVTVTPPSPLPPFYSNKRKTPGIPGKRQSFEAAQKDLIIMNTNKFSEMRGCARQSYACRTENCTRVCSARPKVEEEARKEEWKKGEGYEGGKRQNLLELSCARGTGEALKNRG